MKKKEREQALERHAKELEERLDRMERDMESVRKGESDGRSRGPADHVQRTHTNCAPLENGWLKALLINGAPQPLDDERVVIAK
jgi:hypothetical protein